MVSGGFDTLSHIMEIYFSEPDEANVPDDIAEALMRGLYMEQGMTEEEIDRILVLDVKGQDYFTDSGYRDQHAGGQAFAHDETVMGWLFGEHGEDG